MGSKLPNDLKAASYTVPAGPWQEWQVKLVAGKLPRPPADSQTIDMRITFDRFPHEVEWVLLADQPDTTASSVTGATSFDRQRVITYGPIDSYGDDLADAEHIETILLPPFSGKKTFTLLVTDYAGDGGKLTKRALRMDER